MSIFIEFKEILRTFGLEWFSRYYGIYRGIIVDNEDPEQLGRLIVKVPQVYADEIPNYWAWSKGMFAGKGIGFFAIPNVGDGVWISFENGDPRYPVWEYGWFGSDDTPEDAKRTPPTNMIWQSTVGHKIELDDKNELIRITDKHGHIIEMNSEGISQVSDIISLGSLNGSAEPGVLGDTNADRLNEILNELDQLTEDMLIFLTTQNTASGSVPLLAPLSAGYVTLTQAVTQIKTNIGEIKLTVDDTKSKVVTLD